MNEEARIKLRETRRLMMADLEKSMLRGESPEDSIFYISFVRGSHCAISCPVLGDDKNTEGEGGKGKEPPPSPSVSGGNA